MNSLLTDRLDRALLFFYLFFILSSTFSRALAQMSLGGSLVVFLIIVIRKNYRPFVRSLKWFYIPVSLYLVWLLIAAAMSNDPWHSLYSCRREWIFVAVPIGIYLFQNAELKMSALKMLSIGIIALSIYGIIEYVTNTHWLHFANGTISPIPIDQQIAGTYRRPLTFAAYYSTAAVMLAAVAFSTKGGLNHRRTWNLLGAFLGLVATALTLSRGPVISAGIGLILIALTQQKLIRWFIAGALAMVFLLSISLPGQFERYRKIYIVESRGVHEGSRHFIWENSMAMISRSPLFGVGSGNFLAEYRIQAGPTTPPEYIHGQAHNDLINSAAIGGIPCGIFFASIWIAAFWYMIKGSRNKRFSKEARGFCFVALMGAVVYFLNSLTSAVFAEEETHELIMVIFALGLAPWYRLEPHWTNESKSDC